ncbi:MAG: alkaline phosphatase D family protein [Cryomorphaceae bacterium]
METNLIIGHTTSTSAKIWTRGDGSAGGMLEVLTDQEQRLGEYPLDFDGLKANSCTVEVVHLAPETTYRVRLRIKGELVGSGRFKTFPNTDSDNGFSFMFSSCLLNRGYVPSKDKVFQNLQKISEATKARFMLHCGDQIYIDTTDKSAPSPPLFDHYLSEYEKNWSLPGAAEFLASNVNYMILDDHEIKNDFDNSTLGLEKYRTLGLDAYEAFQHDHNPDTSDNAYFYSFHYGSVAFFVMDTRAERNSAEGYMLSDAQEKAFLHWLDANASRLKVVVSGVPFIIQVSERVLSREDQWGGKAFAEQRKKLNAAMLEKGARNLFFITGDVHSAVHWTQVLTNTATNEEVMHHEFMAGPLGQVNVNGRWAFVRKGKHTHVHEAEGASWPTEGYSYGYKRKNIYHKQFNACVICISSRQDKYEIKATWYGLQTPLNRKHPKQVMQSEISLPKPM